MKKLLKYLLTTGFILFVTAGCINQETKEKEITKDSDNGRPTGDDKMQILIQGEQDEFIVFELNESEAAKSLYDQLPMLIDVESYGTNEIIFYPSEKLDISDTPLAKGPAGTLAYYEPWGNVVMYYGNSGGASGLYALGEAITGEDLISQLNGTIEITKYSENQDSQQSAIKQDDDIQSISNIEEISVGQIDDMYHINITIGSTTFTASLYDNATVRELMRHLPMTLQMNELHNNEKYNYLSHELPTEAQQITQIRTGDLKLFGTNCFVLFYEDFSTSYAYTSLGQVDNPQGLAQALGSGSIQVSIDKIQ